MGKKTQSPDGFPMKLFKLLGPGVAEEMNAMNTRQLDAQIVTCEEAIDESEKAMKADEDVIRLREELGVAKEPYVSAIKAQKAKVKFALWLKEQEG